MWHVECPNRVSCSYLSAIMVFVNETESKQSNRLVVGPWRYLYRFFRLEHLLLVIDRKVLVRR